MSTFDPAESMASSLDSLGTTLRAWAMLVGDDQVGELNIDFLVKSAERLVADVGTAVVLRQPPPPGGRRHGADPRWEAACLCGWRSPAPERVPLSHHYLAVLELGAELSGDQ